MLFDVQILQQADDGSHGWSTDSVHKEPSGRPPVRNALVRLDELIDRGHQARIIDMHGLRWGR